MQSKVFETPAIAEDVLREATRFGGKVTDAVKDGMRVANQQIRRGYDAAEDMLDDAKRTVKRRPIASVLVGFAAGVFFGALFTATALRRR